MKHFTATYSPEDNKLRIYALSRLDADLYARFKEKGFRWAPKQELFVAPSWSPSREDFAIEIAESIEAEQSTMIDRAEAKADRLDKLAEKRFNQSNAFALAADRISERFAGGQPILVGHHSERKARKDQKQMDRTLEKAKNAREAVNYWQYKAEGVERHANRKNDDGVRQRRIKKLLAELRSRQNTLNHANLCIKLWKKILAMTGDDFEKAVRHYVGGVIATGSAAPWDLWSKLDKGDISVNDAAEMALKNAENILNAPYYHRWIAHLLNRLGYEKSQLGPVPLFDGKITATILQEFARNQGTLKPKAVKLETASNGVCIGWQIISPVQLPAHISNNDELSLNNEAWAQLMQSVGYTVPNKKPAQPPILNFKCKYLTKSGGRHSWDKEQTYEQIEMTKEQYKKMNGWILLSKCGTFRFRSGHTGFASNAKRVAVFLTDSKVHETPDSEAVNQVFGEVEA